MQQNESLADGWPGRCSGCTGSTRSCTCRPAAATTGCFNPEPRGDSGHSDGSQSTLAAWRQQLIARARFVCLVQKMLSVRVLTDGIVVTAGPAGVDICTNPYRQRSLKKKISARGLGVADPQCRHQSTKKRDERAATARPVTAFASLFSRQGPRLGMWCRRARRTRRLGRSACRRSGLVDRGPRRRRPVNGVCVQHSGCSSDHLKKQNGCVMCAPGGSRE